MKLDRYKSSTIFLLLIFSVLSNEAKSVCHQILNYGYTPIQWGQLNAKHVAVKNQLREFERYINSGGMDKARGWKKYLLWDKLIASTYSLKSANQVDLAKSVRKLYMNTPGVEKKPFTDLREKIGAYQDAVYLAQLPNPAAEFLNHRNLLYYACQNYQANPSLDLSIPLAQELDWMAKTQQLTALRGTLIQNFSKANALIVISEKIMKENMDEDIFGPVSQNQTGSQMVTANIGFLRSGVTFPVKSKSSSQGNLSYQIVNNPNNAEIRVNYSGYITTDSNSFQKGLTVNSLVQGPVMASKSLFLNNSGGYSLGPTKVSTNMQSQVRSISGGGNLKRRLAWRRSQKDWVKDETLRVANQNTAKTFVENFDKEFANIEPKQQDENELLNKVLHPVVREGAVPKMTGSFSTYNSIGLKITQARRYQIGAPTRCPVPLNISHSDLLLCVHHSFANNTNGVIFGGKEYSDEYMRNLSKLMIDEIPFPLEVFDGRPRWRVRFQKHDPVTLEFLGKDVLRIRSNVAAVNIDGKWHETPVATEAIYAIEPTEWEGLMITRKGDVAIKYDARHLKRTPTASDKVAFDLLSKKLGAFWAPMIDMGGLGIPEGGDIGALNSMEIQEYHTLPGWLVVRAKILDKKVNN